MKEQTEECSASVELTQSQARLFSCETAIRQFQSSRLNPPQE
jgi:hypothetical protein